MLRRFAHSLTLLAAAALLAGACADDGADSEVELVTAADPDTARLGPFEVGGLAYSVELRMLRHGADETVLHMQIVDSAGRIHYERAFDEPDTADHGLTHTVQLTADVVHGSAGSALLISYEHLPAAPMTSESIQLFAQRDDQLVPLWPALAWYGEMEPAARDSDRAVRLADGDVVTVRAWRYHFSVAVPLRLNLACLPDADDCVVPSPQRIDQGTGMAILDVDVDRRPVEAPAFVTLYAVPEGEAADRIPISPDSRIEIVEAAARISIRRADSLELVVRDEHLRVRIDGRDGWIRGPGDFEAIGLPGAG